MVDEAWWSFCKECVVESYLRCVNQKAENLDRTGVVLNLQMPKARAVFLLVSEVPTPSTLHPSDQQVKLGTNHPQLLL